MRGTPFENSYANETRLASTDEARRAQFRAAATTLDWGRRAGPLETPPAAFVTQTSSTAEYERLYGAAAPALPEARPEASRERREQELPAPEGPGVGSATALPGATFDAAFGAARLGSAATAASSTAARAATTAEPDVLLIALPTSGGGLRPLEGAGRAGAIHVSRPYGHLRSIRPVTVSTLVSDEAQPAPKPKRARASAKRATGGLGSATAATSGALGLELMERAEPSSKLPANRPLPQVISAVEIETDAGLFRVERPDTVLTHSDLAWAMATLEAGEPDSVVPLPRRQLALLLTLLPQPEDPEHPEDDHTWGWAHRLRGPWERGPLSAKGRLGRLIAFDPDESGRGMHRACFELLGSEEVVWAVGVPCFRTGSVYELTPINKGLSASRWLTWPLSKTRKGAAERPQWEIARIVYRVGAPRWPLAGVVEQPLGPMGVAG